MASCWPRRRSASTNAASLFSSEYACPARRSRARPSAPRESAGQRRAEIRGRAPGFLKREQPGEVVNGEDDVADVEGGRRSRRNVRGEQDQQKLPFAVKVVVRPSGVVTYLERSSSRPRQRGARIHVRDGHRAGETRDQPDLVAIVIGELVNLAVIDDVDIKRKGASNSPPGSRSRRRRPA